MNWYLKCLKQYADFNGRARRTEYWMFVLFNFIAIVVIGIIDGVIGSFPVLYILYALAVLIPGIAVTVRRLHDIGKSGIMILVGFIPIVGTIWLIVLAVQEGNHGENEYGPDPKAS